MRTLTSAEIKKRALAEGFKACGITGVWPFLSYLKALESLMKDFPETAGFYKPMKKRANVRGFFPNAKSIIVCVRDYSIYKVPKQAKGHIGRNYLFDSRRQGGPDSMAAGNFSEYLKDSGMKVRKGGVPDRLAAARAAVAKIGRNTFAFSGESGSWINLVTYVVDAELEPEEPDFQSPCPPGCDACIRACPTGALYEPYRMRMDRCIAYLTYGAPELPIDNMQAMMGEWVYGCDVCQEACPLNKKDESGQKEVPELEAVAETFSPEALSRMDERTYREVVHPLFYYISQENIERWRQNARRALVNRSRDFHKKANFGCKQKN